MELIQAVVYGVVQGLTEFLPISSTAHLRIVPELFDWQDPGTEFSAIIQLGTLIAVLIYFQQDIYKLLFAAFDSLLKRNLMISSDSRMAWSIALGTIPIIFFGLIFKDFIKKEARELWVIGICLIVLAILLYLAEIFSKQNRKIRDLKFWQIQLIGLTQALSLIPGCSRSGSTIMGGFFVGLNRESSARFSFLLGLPAILGSSLFELNELIKVGIGSHDYAKLAVGIFFAFLSGYLSINFFLRIIRIYGTLFFVIYRIILGVLILVFFV